MRFIVDESTGVAVVHYLRNAGHDVLAVAEVMLHATARWLRTTFPDLHAVLHEVVVEGDGKVGRLTLSGTLQGDYLGVAGSGRSFSVQHLHMYRVRDGKLAEHWACRDDLGQLTQRGWVLPPPPA